MVYECYEKFFIYLSFKMKFYTFANAMAIAIVVLAATEATPMATEALWEWCDNEWAWEECSWMWYRASCDFEDWGDCGWVYWDDWMQEEFWVSCEWKESWLECN